MLLTSELFFRFEPRFRTTTGVTANGQRFLSIPTEFAPYTDGFNKKKFRSENLNTNAWGFRTLRELGEKQPDEKRIFVLGGSAAAGWGASHDNTTFPLITEKLLHQAGRSQAFFFNAGVDGFNSNQEWVLMATKIMDLKPDLVILFDGYNDMHFSMRENWTADYNIYSAQTLELMSFHPWYLHSALLSAIANRTKEGRTRSKFVGKSGIYRPSYFDTYLRNISKIAWAVRSQRGKTLVLLQPHFLITERPLTEPEKLISKNGHDINMYTNYSELMVKHYRYAQTHMKRFSHNSAWEFQDSNQFFKNNTDTIFQDEVHLTDTGHSILASHLSKLILERNLLFSKVEESRCLSSIPLEVTGEIPNTPP